MKATVQMTILGDDHQEFRQERHSAAPGIGVLLPALGCRLAVTDFSTFGLGLSASTSERLAAALEMGSSHDFTLVVRQTAVYTGNFQVVRRSLVGQNGQGRSFWAVSVSSGALPLEKLVVHNLVSEAEASARERISALPEAYRLLSLECCDFLQRMVASLQDTLRKWDSFAGINQASAAEELSQAVCEAISRPLTDRLNILSRQFESEPELRSRCFHALGRLLSERFGISLISEEVARWDRVPSVAGGVPAFLEGGDVPLSFRRALELYLADSETILTLKQRHGKVFTLLRERLDSRQVPVQTGAGLSALLICPVARPSDLEILGHAVRRNGRLVNLDVLEIERGALLRTQRQFHEWQLGLGSLVKCRYFAGMVDEISQFAVMSGYDQIFIPCFLDGLDDSAAYHLLSLLFHHLAPSGSLYAGSRDPSEKSQNICEVTGRARPHYRTAEDLIALSVSLSAHASSSHDETDHHSFIEFTRYHGA